VWLARSERADVYLSGGVAAIRRGGAETVVQSLTDRSWDDIVDEWAGEAVRTSWRIWLGGSLCRLLRVEPIPGVRTIEEAEAVVARLASENGQSLEARLALWSARRPWIACCSPAGFADGVMSVADKHRISLVSIRPWWSSVVASPMNGVACCDDESISSWHTDKQGQVVKCSTALVDEGRQTQALQRMRVSGPLQAFRLDLRAPSAAGTNGFSAIPIQERGHAVAS